MNILVINSGSSSMKFSLFAVVKRAEDLSAPACLLDGEVSGVGGPTASLRIRSAQADTPATPVSAATAAQAMQLILAAIRQPSGPAIDAVGYRVVHPGPHLHDHQKITPEVLERLEQAAPFAPLHDPAALEVIHEGLASFPSLPHFACFDTVFHRTMPAEATTFPIPETFRKQGARRYGFHGLSCESIVLQLRTHLAAHSLPLPRRMVIAHLGSGCSVTALSDGLSVDTTMGLTPTGGIVMGTRPGDLDPGLLLFLLRQQQGSREAASSTLESMLNHASGMVALTGLPNDMRAVRAAAAAFDPKALLALKIFTRSITKAIGSFSFLLGGLDAIVFAGGIGEHDPLTRAETLAGLEDLGIALDPTLNQPPPKKLPKDPPPTAGGLRRLNAESASPAVFIVPAEEDRMIAAHVFRMSTRGV